MLPDGKPIVEIITCLGRYFIRNNEGQWFGCGSNQHGELGPDNFKQVNQLFYVDPSEFENEKTNESEILHSKIRNGY